MAPVEYDSAGKEGSDAICCIVNGPRDDHTKGSELEKDKYHMISLICRI